MFAVNVDKPTHIVRVHEWQDGTPQYRHCEERYKQSQHGGWRFFESQGAAVQFAQNTGSKVRPCRFCKPTGTGNYS